MLAAAVWSASQYGLPGQAVHPRQECRVPASSLLQELVAHVAAALEKTGDLNVLARLEALR